MKIDWVKIDCLKLPFHRSKRREVMNILLSPFVCANQIHQEKRQQKMLRQEEHLVDQEVDSRWCLEENS